MQKNGVNEGINIQDNESESHILQLHNGDIQAVLEDDHSATSSINNTALNGTVLKGVTSTDF